MSRIILARPGLGDRIMAAADGPELPAVPGPARDELLRMLA